MFWAAKVIYFWVIFFYFKEIKEKMVKIWSDLENQAPKIAKFHSWKLCMRLLWTKQDGYLRKKKYCKLNWGPLWTLWMLVDFYIHQISWKSKSQLIRFLDIFQCGQRAANCSKPKNIYNFLLKKVKQHIYSLKHK